MATLLVTKHFTSDIEIITGMGNSTNMRIMSHSKYFILFKESMTAMKVVFGGHEQIGRKFQSRDE